jgi:prolyl-tRNA editing enzyme YbaK/EbsC (Cys-tRNA(Pro) deacylase)
VRRGAREDTVSRVLDYLVGRGRPFLVMPGSGATTVRATAEAHGVDLSEVLRTEILMAAAGPALMLVPATHYLDLELARSAVGDPSARLATHAEIRAFAPGCEVTAVPPMSLLLLAPMYVDPSVTELTQVIFPAGRAGLLVCMEHEDLFRDDPYVVVPLTHGSAIPQPPPPPPTRRELLADDALVPVHVAERRSTGGRGADVA